MPTHVITIVRANNRITIQPAQLRVPFASGVPAQDIQWQASGPGLKITGVTLVTNPGNEVSTPTKVSDTLWTAQDTNQGQGDKTITYAISIDPEIVNEAKPPSEGEVDEPGGGRGRGRGR